MIVLYHAPRTRSVRIHWLLEELGIPYRLEVVEFVPPGSGPFAQRTPFGKLPAIEDGDVKMFESGAIVEYILDRYGRGRLAPAPGTSARGPYLQWIHFAEATAFPPIGNLAWHMMFRQDADQLPGAMADYRGWALGALDVLERALAGKDYLLGGELSGADIMMGYTVICMKWLGLLDERHPNVAGYLARLGERPAFRATVLG
jgi:glutathione S-transferase